MRCFRAVPVVVLAALLTLSSPVAFGQTSDDAVLARAVAAFDKGDRRRALALVEGVLAHSPDNPDALYRSGQINLMLGNVDAARGRAERLVKISGNFLAAWELMTQVTQTQGDLERRDEAIKRVKIAISTALDPLIRQRGDFIRDIMETSKGELLADDFFTRVGTDYTRYQFALGDPRQRPDTGLLLRTDAATTETWQETALLAPDKPLFHLDMVDPGPDGTAKVAVYQYYAGEPDYDTVRAEVLRILRGEAKPLSGEPGSLQGAAKQ